MSLGNIIKNLIVIAVLAAGGFAYYMFYQGLNPLDMDDINTATTSTKNKIDQISKTVAEKDSMPEESRVYKRKDADGNWYYSNEPPKEGEEAEEMIYRSDTNVLPPLPEDNNKEKSKNK